MSNTEWQPIHIDIEPTFNAFIRSFHDGKLISDLLTDKSNLPRNADYFFPRDDVICELKCLEKNPTEAEDWASRIARAFRAAGYTWGEMVRVTFSGAPLPEKVTGHLAKWLRESIRNVVKQGNRQLRASKMALGRPEAKGVLLIANDNNYGFGPMAMLRVIGDAAVRLPDNHVDATVYFTPNVFHRAPDSDVAWNVWSPQYRDETDEGLSEFINELGRAWGAFVELTTCQSHVERREMPNVNDAHAHVSSMHPVRRLGRQE